MERNNVFIAHLTNDVSGRFLPAMGYFIVVTFGGASDHRICSLERRNQTSRTWTEKADAPLLGMKITAPQNWIGRRSDIFVNHLITR